MSCMGQESRAHGDRRMTFLTRRNTVTTVGRSEFDNESNFALTKVAPSGTQSISTRTHPTAPRNNTHKKNNETQGRTRTRRRQNMENEAPQQQRGGIFRPRLPTLIATNPGQNDQPAPRVGQTWVPNARR